MLQGWSTNSGGCLAKRKSPKVDFSLGGALRAARKMGQVPLYSLRRHCQRGELALASEYSGKDGIVGV